ncbi:MAG: aminotransferase class IV, partial [Desulfuromonadales bacterium]
MIFNLDGEFLQPEQAVVPVTDGAFLYGDSLFETMKARDGRICFLEEHLDRIELSSRLLSFPFSRSRVREALEATAVRLPSPASRLRLTLTRGDFSGPGLPPPGGERFVIQACPYTEPSAPELRAGAACVLAPNRRVNPLSHLPQMKRGNYADCLYALDHARRHSAREALFVTPEGVLLEGATSNLFLVCDGVLLTPPAGELVLAGIMRRQVLDAASRLDIPAREEPVPLPDLYMADEVFLTNALTGPFPVAQVEGRAVARGDLAEALRREVDR